MHNTFFKSERTWILNYVKNMEKKTRRWRILYIIILTRVQRPRETSLIAESHVSTAILWNYQSRSLSTQYPICSAWKVRKDRSASEEKGQGRREDGFFDYANIYGHNGTPSRQLLLSSRYPTIDTELCTPPRNKQ